METSSGKRLKKSSEADDRISNLPDDVLLHILSFIPTFDSISTCMLSSRWKHLWKHVPTLNFDDTLPPLDRTRNYHNVRFAIFVNKVWTLHVPKDLEKLSLTCSNDDIYDVGRWVGNSITRNIHSLDLSIYYVHPGHVDQLPSNLFTCKTLEALVLKSRCEHLIVNVPTVVCLPKLKELKLAGVKCHDDQRECSARLISSCSSLEKLVIEQQTLENDYFGFNSISSSTLRDVEFRLGQPPSLIGYNPEIFCSALRRLNLSFTLGLSGKRVKVPSNVLTCKTLEQLILKGPFLICSSSSICLPKLTFLALFEVVFEDDEIFSRLISSCTSLESLNVKFYQEVELRISSSTLKNIEIIDLLYHHLVPCCKLVINAPACKYLTLRNLGHVDYQNGDVASLERADVDVQILSMFLTNFNQALRHVKSLKIWQGSFNFGVFEPALLMFNRLTDLDITVNNWTGYGLFQLLITNSTKLESLAFELDVEASPYIHPWRNLRSVPTCLLSSLRSVSIRNFKGREEDELAMALYILTNAKIMEKMEVRFWRYFRHSNSKDTERELCNKILNVRRGSEICNVVLIK